MKEFCVDLKIAKELKINGYPQNTNFYHEIYTYNDGSKENGFVDYNKFLGWENSDDHTFFSAPISDEILKELPKEIEYKFCYFLEILCLTSSYNIFYQSNGGEELKEFDDKNLANALAKMWLYLKKEGYIK